MAQPRADCLPFTQREPLKDNRSGRTKSIQEKSAPIRNFRYKPVAARTTIGPLIGASPIVACFSPIRM